MFGKIGVELIFHLFSKEFYLYFKNNKNGLLSFVVSFTFTFTFDSERPHNPLHLHTQLRDLMLLSLSLWPLSPSIPLSLSLHTDLSRHDWLSLMLLSSSSLLVLNGRQMSPLASRLWVCGFFYHLCHTYFVVDHHPLHRPHEFEGSLLCLHQIYSRFSLLHRLCRALLVREESLSQPLFFDHCFVFNFLYNLYLYNFFMNMSIVFCALFFWW